MKPGFSDGGCRCGAAAVDLIFAPISGLPWPFAACPDPAVCAADAAPAVLDYWKSLPEGKGAAAIGRVTTGHGRVMLETLIGGRRLVSLPEGELLPRIC